MSDWLPPSTFEERLKELLVPARLYHVVRAHRELRGGDRELALLPFLAEAGRNSVDAGANKGVYTYWLQKCSRHVYAYEPNPKIFRILQRSVLGARVRLSRAALSDRSGEDVLFIPKRKRSYSNQLASLRKDKFPGICMEVPVTTRCLDDEDVGNVGFIKIDVEGFERNVLLGARETIRRFRPVLLVEIEELHTGERIEETLDFVRGLGYGGFFLAKGALRTLANFDPERDHRHPQPGAYVYNFVFLPD